MCVRHTCLSQFVIERVVKWFPLLYHNFWLQGGIVADEIFVTLSAVLDEVIYETLLIAGNIVQARLYCTWWQPQEVGNLGIDFLAVTAPTQLLQRPGC